MSVMTQHADAAETAAKPDRIRVAIYADEGVTKERLPELTKRLPADERFDVKFITAKEIRSGKLANFDVLIHPGGGGSSQSKSLGDIGRRNVKKFVADGGGFVGICAGAYLASAEYPWALHLLDARVVDDEHWARGIGQVKLRISPACRKSFGLNETDTKLVDIDYENGPLLGPASKDDIDDFETLATFESEIATNGAPPGVMKGTAAIARGTYKNGRAICFSPHPERSMTHERLLRAAVRWAAGHNQVAPAAASK